MTEIHKFFDMVNVMLFIGVGFWIGRTLFPKCPEVKRKKWIPKKKKGKVMQFIIDHGWFPPGINQEEQPVENWGLCVKSFDDELIWLYGTNTNTDYDDPDSEGFVMLDKPQLTELVQWLIDQEIVELSVIVNQED